MTTPLYAPAPAPLFYTLSMFKAAGLPGRTKAYALNNLGLLNLTVDVAGRTGITAAEAARYFAQNRPLAEVKRQLKANAARGRPAGVVRHAG